MHKCTGTAGLRCGMALKPWAPAARGASIRTLLPGGSARGNVSDASTLVGKPSRTLVVPRVVSDRCRLAAARWALLPICSELR